ncbi:PIN domain-like protein [Amylocystis lapponica]|nr:PIN domain-like protein [Amylocystis lapponica]
MGVKSLWSLLDPVGRPVLLETMEGKSMAIDSSIWIYQFQATMRDKEGRGLVNAHVLGFLRRICKLLFYGIKPVFVFDGAAPVLKRVTISERKKKKSGAALSHAKLAERLLAAQMRREALNHVKPGEKSKGKGKAPSGPVVLDENTVYLEDLDGTLPKTPLKPRNGTAEPSPPSSKKKSRWHDHDPYKLPEVNLREAVAKATRSRAPDPRLATEDELRAFIDEMRPEDFDVSSPAFRELPTEVQYEIVGDMRLKSRQTSYKRLQNMLRVARTPLDFSKEQIKNLKQRNTLTQQLLTTTDSIGKAQISIPIRVASERNREYVLIKNESETGGWVLGIRDDGTKAKPIEIDRSSDHENGNDDDSDADMEEVPLPLNDAPFDADLRDFRRGQAPSALASRYSPKRLTPLTTSVRKKPKPKPLFEPEDDEPPMLEEASDDSEFALALQESLEHAEESDIRRALEMSRAQTVNSPPRSTTGASTSNFTLDGKRDFPERRHSASHAGLRGFESISDGDDDDLYASPTRLETALSIAGAGPSRRPLSRSKSQSQSQSRQIPSVLITNFASEESADDMEEVLLPIPAIPPPTPPARVFPKATPPPSEPGFEAEPEREPPSDRLVGLTSALPPVPMAMGTTSPSGPNADATKDTLTAAADDHEGSDLEYLDSYELVHPVAEEAPSDTEQRWSRSPSPTGGPSQDVGGAAADDWDAAQEMDPQAEEGEFARFISQVKGKDIDAVRREIDDEIRGLNQQKKAALRDAEDITQQMVAQIMLMLRLFGIPYITAPMEAEAQCAALLALGLVDGIITDDSDVFLFGGARVLKNMFNQSKTVECFLLTDLDRELGLDRDKLVRLAYLLGSDYTDGLPGIGPVVAMELLTEFPGADGLHKFKHWWQKVQSGKDTEGDTQTRFRKRFKKRFKELYLPDDWPNPAVRDAYYHPTVDESEEPFKWGLPDLDALRDFFNAELGWHETKVDELLQPIIRKMGKRGQASALNKQGNLGSFLDLPVGSGSHAPRKRQAYASKRLQQVVSDFRKERARLQAEEREHSAPASERDTHSNSDDECAERPAKKRKTAGAKGTGKGKGKEASTGAKKTTAPAARGEKSARGKAKRQQRRRKPSGSAIEEDDPVPELPGPPPPPLAVNLRPRPKARYQGSAAAAPEDAVDESNNT